MIAPVKIISVFISSMFSQWSLWSLLISCRLRFVSDHVLLNVVVPVPLFPCDEAYKDTSSLITETGDAGAVWLTQREHHNNTQMSLSRGIRFHSAFFIFW